MRSGRLEEGFFRGKVVEIICFFPFLRMLIDGRNYNHIHKIHHKIKDETIISGYPLKFGKIFFWKYRESRGKALIKFRIHKNYSLCWQPGTFWKGGNLLLKFFYLDQSPFFFSFSIY